MPFLEREVDFLGHIVSSDGVFPDPSKISKIGPFHNLCKKSSSFLAWPTIAGALSRILQHFHFKCKKPFKWTDECEKAFSQLKNSLTTAPILDMPDWTKPLILEPTIVAYNLLLVVYHFTSCLADRLDCPLMYCMELRKTHISLLENIPDF